MKYKVGDEVLVRVRITDLEKNNATHPEGVYNGETSKSKRFSAFNPEDVHGLAPATEVDWSDPALMSRKVRIRDSDCCIWEPARFVDVAGCYFRALTPSGTIRLARYCELVGDDE